MQPNTTAPGRKRPGAVLLAPAIALVATFAPPVQAQVPATSEYLERMDSDGYGRVSLDEYLARMGYAFERMDRNGDGVLDSN